MTSLVPSGLHHFGYFCNKFFKTSTNLQDLKILTAGYSTTSKKVTKKFLAPEKCAAGPNQLQVSVTFRCNHKPKSISMKSHFSTKCREGFRVPSLQSNILKAESKNLLGQRKGGFYQNLFSNVID